MSVFRHPSSFAPILLPLEAGELLRGARDARFAQAWEMASPTSFRAMLVTDIAVLRQA